MPNWKLEGSSVVWDEDAPDPVDDTADDGEFDPGDHSIPDVKKYVDENPDESQRIYDAEVEGKGRQTLLDWLTAD